MRILITGGCGFIGSHLVDALVEKHSVKVLDSLEYQVHGGKLPDYLNPEAEYIFGDIRDRDIIEHSIEDIDLIFHEASVVGVGQSMYQIRKYTDVNTLGTANLLDILVNNEHDVKKIIVAASMSSYGEGSYECENCGIVNPPLRSQKQMQQNKWELHCPICGAMVNHAPTNEEKIQNCNSIYALTKMDQEHMVMMIGKTYGLQSVALRYFNVYGPRQSLSNPYTGVAAIFMSRIKNNNPPIIYEDGLQTRDFVSVHDIVQANILTMEKSKANYEVFNVGTGIPLTVQNIAETIAETYRSDIKAEITNKFRKGDVRHCYADISKIQKLGFKQSISFEKGMRELIKWSSKQIAVDKFEHANNELQEKGLI
ncbi:MAG TPA: NAD-dependent epimerase/dehydratase family protein [Candidatus Methylomirabilis sp.]|nr:NAD-dependent epimerase/dehydratase family protein [Candidatus Methylomirabilis sp.]